MFTVEASYNRYRLPGDNVIAVTVTVIALAAADEVMLQIAVPEGASVQMVQQVAPTVQDLAPRYPTRRGGSADIATGAWSRAESRRYNLLLHVVAGEESRDMRAARIRLIAGSELLGEAPVVISWISDELAAQQPVTLDVHSHTSTRPVRTRGFGAVDYPMPPPDPARVLVAQLPAQVPVAAEVSLLVRVSEVPVAATATTELRGLILDPDGTQVTVVVQAPHELVPLLPLEQVILVPETGDSPPARFAFQARGAGLHRLTATAWAGGTFLGELGLELSVADSGPAVDAPARWAGIADLAARPGEVTLQVRFDGERYTFQLLSDADLFEPVLAESLTAAPSAAVERTIATLRAMATGTSGYAEGNARTWMEQAGVGLWNDMVPEQIKDQFWRLRDQIGAFSVATGHDVIPWELLYPLAPGHDEGFLVEQFPVLRRVYGQRRSRWFLARRPVYVVPAGSPANAKDEVAAISRVLGGDSRVCAEIDTLSDLITLIESGHVGPIHFACHNTFMADAGGSAIPMKGGSFVPMLLNKAVTLRALARERPLIFMNACRSAGEVPEYTRMMGWAQQFMAAGAGAFTGTLWAVRSDSAKVFAETFYEGLAGGIPLGAASRQAREVAARQHHDDPTWLAYSVYGDPAATGVQEVDAWR